MKQDTEGNLFSRENSNVMRGLAIMAIMYHNLLHTKTFGFSVENEMSFSYQRVEAFLQAMKGDRCWGADVVSFLGWLGVPVFIFLTGYGLAIKYTPSQLNNHNTPEQFLEGSRFLRHSYLKLFLLMLPAVFLFAIPDLVVHEYLSVAKKLFSLTLLSNFNYPVLSYSPGVYWYFSLTFQYYVLFYLLQHRWFTDQWLFIGSVASLVILVFLVEIEMPWLLSVYRHCFTGWFPLFSLGIWQAHRDDKYAGIGWGKCSMIVVCTAVLVFLMNLNLIAWSVVPIVALMFFISLSRLLLMFNRLRLIIAWIGRYSAFVFVCHPIARAIVYRINNSIPLYGVIVIYFFLTMLLAVLYCRLYKKIIVLFKV